MTAMRANWNYPTAIKFGAGRIAELADVCQGAGIARPLLVTDADLIKLPMLADIRRRLKDAGLGDSAYSQVTANPVSRQVIDGVIAYRAGRHDGVIAIGGGSALDAGKAVAFMAQLLYHRLLLFLDYTLEGISASKPAMPVNSPWQIRSARFVRSRKTG